MCRYRSPPVSSPFAGAIVGESDEMLVIFDEFFSIAVIQVHFFRECGVFESVAHAIHHLKEVALV